MKDELDGLSIKEEYKDILLDKKSLIHSMNRI